MSRPRKGPRLLAKGSGYILRYTDETGRLRERRLSATNEHDAKREEATFILEQGSKRKSGGPIDPSEYPISAALHAYSAEHGIYTSQPDRLAAAVDNLNEFWGERMVGDTRPQGCKDYLAHRQRTGIASRGRNKEKKKRPVLSQSTVRRELVFLRAAYNHARKEGRITYAPYVWLPPETPERDRWLTRNEVAALIWAARTAYAKHYLPRFILLALYTAARKSAILELTWKQVNLKTGEIDFNEPGRVENNKKRARITAPPRLLWFLKKWHRRREGDYVVNDHGERLLDVKHGFRNAAKRAKVDGATAHTLRHTAGTWLKEAGIHKDDIGEYLGHRSSKTTAKYTHTGAARLLPVAVALQDGGRGFSGSFSGTSPEGKKPK